MNLLIEPRRATFFGRVRWDVYMSQDYDGLVKIGVPMETFKTKTKAWEYCCTLHDENPTFKNAAIWT